MAANIDPRKVRYPPEALIEAMSIPTVSTGGSVVAQYLCEPYRISIENMVVESENIDVVVGADGFPEKTKTRASSVFVPPGSPLPLRVSARRSAEVMLTSKDSDDKSNVWARWNVVVRDEKLLDRVKTRDALSKDDYDIVRNLNLDENLTLGTAPYQRDVLGRTTLMEFDEIIPVSRQLDSLSASTSYSVGGAINCSKYREVKVLLGLIVEASNLFTTVNDSYIRVDRDDDPSYMKLDITALPRNTFMPCYVPFIDELEVFVDIGSTAPARGIGVGFVYGIRDMNTKDHILWDIPYANTKEEEIANRLISEYNFKPQLRAGVIQ